MVTLKKKRIRKEDQDERSKTATAGADDSGWRMGGKPPRKKGK
jgi:hypothetical protein